MEGQESTLWAEHHIRFSRMHERNIGGRVAEEGNVQMFVDKNPPNHLIFNDVQRRR